MSSNSILVRRPRWRKPPRCGFLARYPVHGMFASFRMRRGLGGRIPARSRRPVSSIGSLLVALIAGLSGIALVMLWRAGLEETLYVHRIDGAAAPILDGDAPDAAWRLARPTIVSTGFGGDAGGKGGSTVEIRAVHDGTWAYFRFTWTDPTRSLKHLPLVKRADGWHVVHDRYDRADERSFVEDKFAVLITNQPTVSPGDRTFRSEPTPIADKPATSLEVWQWKASSGGLLGWIDKDSFDLTVDPSHAAAGEAPYRRFVSGAGTTQLYGDNFEAQAVGGYERPVQPKRLPKDWKATYAALGKVDLEADQGDSDGSRWWMTIAESETYSSDLDTLIPVGTVIPGSLILAEDLAQRAQVRGAARWGVGKWTLEVARRLDAEHPDVRIGSNSRMWVAVFDHAQTYHTRHVRPIHLELQQ